jgi:hypothetical protein
MKEMKLILITSTSNLEKKKNKVIDDPILFLNRLGFTKPELRF